jgi:hypothetical protein
MLILKLLRTLINTTRPSGWLALLGLLLASPVAFAQLSGAYTINNGQPTAGTNYASFGAAAAALTTSGVSGPVTFEVSGGPYTEQVGIGVIAGTSATNTVTFNGGGATLQYGANTAAQRAVFTLSGVKYVTLSNLIIIATGVGANPAAYGWGIQLVNNADNCTISGCTVTVDATSTSSSNFAGIVSSASTTAAFTTGAAASSNLTITGNTITGGYYGIVATGNTDAAPTPGLVISNNTVRDFYLYGVYSIFMTGARYTGNDIARPTRSTVAAYYGLNLLAGIYGAVIDGNRLHNPFTGAPNAASDAYGIALSSTATAATANVVSNNLVYNMDGNGIIYALYNTSSSNVLYYHNTIYLNDQNNYGSGAAYGLYKTTGTDVDFRNNIVWVARAGVGANYGVYVSSATGTLTSNYNDLVVGGTNPVTGYYVSTPYATLATWRTANGGAFDQNSQQANPQFSSPNTGNLQPTAALLNNTGTPISRVLTDIAGAVRSTTAPDMGAYEFTPATNDAALQSIDSPVAPVLTGARTVAVTLRNNGSAPLTSVQLQYVLNGGAPVVQSFALSPALAVGATQALTFTVPATVVAGANTLTVTSSLPNGSPDGYPANDSQTLTLTIALAGTYTIDKTQPTGGTNFASFAVAGQALTSGGVAAPVRFNVLNGPYNEQFAVGTIPGASATDSVVVDGGASKQTIAFTGTLTQPATVLLNGSDYVTLQNLTIRALGTDYGVGVHLVAQATTNRVRNCIISAPSSTSSSTVNAGIAASGSTGSISTLGAAAGLRLENNVISGGYYGISFTGAGSSNLAAGVRITGNEVTDFYVYGISLAYTAGAQIINNNVHRLTRPSVSSFYGLYLSNNVGIAAERNRFHDTFTANLTNTASTYLIYGSSNDGLAGQENDFVNNIGYDLNGSGTEYFVYNSSSDYNRYYHNTFVSSNQVYAGTAQTYGLYQTGAAVGIDVRNNIFSLTRNGTGNRVALAFTTTTSTIVSNYNDLYLSTGPNFYTGTYGFTNYSTLAAWQAINSAAYDQASQAVNPQFAAGSLVPSATTPNAAGQPLARVPRDFNNVLRSTPPDLGAYEFTPSTDDVVLVGIITPGAASSVGTNPVAVTIRNAGATALGSVTLSYTLNGGTAVTQAFTLTPALAVGASQQLTFATSLVVPVGYNILTVTASLPNGQPDATPANNTLTTTFTLTAPPANDEPCAALGLSTSALISTNAGATTSTQPGIVLPACSPATTPSDVWFSLVPSGTSTTLTLSGAPAGLVRVFTSPSCSAGPFTQVFCASSGGSSAGFTAPLALTGLTAGTRYYVAVSGYANADVTGSFTISATALLATHTSAAATAALAVYPNPSGAGQLFVRLATLSGAASAELLNALGQVVRQQALAGPSEQLLSTQGLAAGLYTLRVQAGTEVLTRKVVLQ